MAGSGGSGDNWGGHGSAGSGGGGGSGGAGGGSGGGAGGNGGPSVLIALVGSRATLNDLNTNYYQLGVSGAVGTGGGGGKAADNSCTAETGNSGVDGNVQKTVQDRVPERRLKDPPLSWPAQGGSKYLLMPTRIRAKS